VAQKLGPKNGPKNDEQNQHPQWVLNLSSLFVPGKWPRFRCVFLSFNANAATQSIRARARGRGASTTCGSDGRKSVHHQGGHQANTDVWPKTKQRGKLPWSATATTCATGFSSGYKLRAPHRRHTLARRRQHGPVSNQSHTQSTRNSMPRILFLQSVLWLLNQTAFKINFAVQMIGL